MKPAYDLAILGGGCAGLSLARKLAQNGYSGRIVIIEPRNTYDHDRTWCFWAERDHALSDLVSKHWHAWRISSAERSVEHVGSHLAYQQIRSGDFYGASLRTLSGAPNISLRCGLAAHALNEGSNTVEIETNEGLINAEFVIDTRPRKSELESATVWQIFSGGDVETETACFDPSSAALMNNMTSDAAGLKFTYMLPMTPHRALVQTTRFSLSKRSPQSMDHEFEADLRSLVKGGVTLKRWERGCLPMGQHPEPPNPSKRIVRAGQAAGALRASSGYGFLRIQDWAQSLAAQIVTGESPMQHSHGSPLERQMDAIFLAALKQSPHQAADWFVRIAKHTTGDEFGRFMSQVPSMHLWLKIISALPKAPFLRSLISRTEQYGQSKTKALI